jgi:hypothetical protein
MGGITRTAFAAARAVWVGAFCAALTAGAAAAQDAVQPWATAPGASAPNVPPIYQDVMAPGMANPAASPLAGPSGALPVAPPVDLHAPAPAGEPSVAPQPFMPAETEPWSWQCLPEGIIYHSYLAGAKEPRFASQWVHDVNQGWIWDVTLGARVGIFRYGTTNAVHPEGWQLDMEGAAFPRLSLEESLDVWATDFRFGVPLTYGIGNYQTKFALYHECSHLGDELMLNHPETQAERINYARNCLVWGNSYYPVPDVRFYGEVGWSFQDGGGAKPWEFQFGMDYSPAQPTTLSHPAPFLAVNGHLRQDVNFGGNLVVQTGYQWRGPTNHLFRAGVEYYNGKSDEYEFFDKYENKVGLGVWYDF